MPEVLPSVPGFSDQQVHDLVNIIHSVMQQYFAPPNQNQTTPASTPPPSDQPPSTPPTPQETQKEEDEQPLQQTTVKSITESITESTTTHGSSVPNSKSTISIIPRLCTARSSGDSAACLSKALLFACQHIMFFNTLLGYTLLGYIGHSEGLEATGDG